MLTTLLLLVLAFLIPADSSEYLFFPGQLTKEKIETLLRKKEELKSREEKVDFISSIFLGTRYEWVKWNEEVMLVNLAKLDCMTFVEYVEALLQAGSFQEFLENLREIRYRGGVVSYETRRHFFTDWLEIGFKDIGKKVGGEKAVRVKKILNKGGVLKGVPAKEVEFHYIPVEAFTREVISRLKTGDVIGVYSEKDWLDVSHLGIVVKKEGKVFVRHASSRFGKVVDEPLGEFLKRTKGLVILRKE